MQDDKNTQKEINSLADTFSQDQIGKIIGALKAAQPAPVINYQPESQADVLPTIEDEDRRNFGQKFKAAAMTQNVVGRTMWLGVRNLGLASATGTNSEIDVHQYFKDNIDDIARMEGGSRIIRNYSKGYYDDVDDANTLYGLMSLDQQVGQMNQDIAAPGVSAFSGAGTFAGIFADPLVFAAGPIIDYSIAGLKGAKSADAFSKSIKAAQASRIAYRTGTIAGTGEKAGLGVKIGREAAEGFKFSLIAEPVLGGIPFTPIDGLGVEESTVSEFLSNFAANTIGGGLVAGILHGAARGIDGLRGPGAIDSQIPTGPRGTESARKMIDDVTQTLTDGSLEGSPRSNVDIVPNSGVAVQATDFAAIQKRNEVLGFMSETGVELPPDIKLEDLSFALDDVIRNNPNAPASQISADVASALSSPAYKPLKDLWDTVNNISKTNDPEAIKSLNEKLLEFGKNNPVPNDLLRAIGSIPGQPALDARINLKLKDVDLNSIIEATARNRLDYARKTGAKEDVLKDLQSKFEDARARRQTSESELGQLQSQFDAMNKIDMSKLTGPSKAPPLQDLDAMFVKIRNNVMNVAQSSNAGDDFMDELNQALSDLEFRVKDENLNDQQVAEAFGELVRTFRSDSADPLRFDVEKVDQNNDVLDELDLDVRDFERRIGPPLLGDDIDGKLDVTEDITTDTQEDGFSTVDEPFLSRFEQRQKFTNQTQASRFLDEADVLLENAGDASPGLVGRLQKLIDSFRSGGAPAQGEKPASRFIDYEAFRDLLEENIESVRKGLPSIRDLTEKLGFDKEEGIAREVFGDAFDEIDKSLDNIEDGAGRTAFNELDELEDIATRLDNQEVLQDIRDLRLFSDFVSSADDLDRAIGNANVSMREGEIARRRTTADEFTSNERNLADTENLLRSLEQDIIDARVTDNLDTKALNKFEETLSSLRNPSEEGLGTPRLPFEQTIRDISRAVDDVMIDASPDDAQFFAHIEDLLRSARARRRAALLQPKQPATVQKPTADQNAQSPSPVSQSTVQIISSAPARAAAPVPVTGKVHTMANGGKRIPNWSGYIHKYDSATDIRSFNDLLPDFSNDIVRRDYKKLLDHFGAKELSDVDFTDPANNAKLQGNMFISWQQRAFPAINSRFQFSKNPVIAGWFNTLAEPLYTPIGKTQGRWLGEPPLELLVRQSSQVAELYQGKIRQDFNRFARQTLPLTVKEKAALRGGVVMQPLWPQSLREKYNKYMSMLEYYRVTMNNEIARQTPNVDVPNAQRAATMDAIMFGEDLFGIRFSDDARLKLGERMGSILEETYLNGKFPYIHNRSSVFIKPDLNLDTLLTVLTRAFGLQQPLPGGPRSVDEIADIFGMRPEEFLVTTAPEERVLVETLRQRFNDKFLGHINSENAVSLMTDPQLRNLVEFDINQSYAANHKFDAKLISLDKLTKYAVVLNQAIEAQTGRMSPILDDLLVEISNLPARYRQLELGTRNQAIASRIDSLVEKAIGSVGEEAKKHIDRMGVTGKTKTNMVNEVDDFIELFKTEAGLLPEKITAGAAGRILKATSDMLLLQRSGLTQAATETPKAISVALAGLTPVKTTKSILRGLSLDIPRYFETNKEISAFLENIPTLYESMEALIGRRHDNINIPEMSRWETPLHKKGDIKGTLGNYRERGPEMLANVLEVGGRRLIGKTSGMNAVNTRTRAFGLLHALDHFTNAEYGVIPKVFDSINDATNVQGQLDPVRLQELLSERKVSFEDYTRLTDMLTKRDLELITDSIRNKSVNTVSINRRIGWKYIGKNLGKDTFEIPDVLERDAMGTPSRETSDTNRNFAAFVNNYIEKQMMATPGLSDKFAKNPGGFGHRVLTQFMGANLAQMNRTFVQTGNMELAFRVFQVGFLSSMILLGSMLRAKLGGYEDRFWSDFEEKPLGTVAGAIAFSGLFGFWGGLVTPVTADALAGDKQGVMRQIDFSMNLPLLSTYSRLLKGTIMGSMKFVEGEELSPSQRKAMTDLGSLGFLNSALVQSVRTSMDMFLEDESEVREYLQGIFPELEEK